MAGCEGALLVVDAAQGVEAQTLANCYTAIEMDTEVVPVLNKIDLPQADAMGVAQEIEDIVGIEAVDAVQCSAKTGLGIDDVLERIVRQIPPPKGEPEEPLQALIIDSGLIIIRGCFFGSRPQRNVACRRENDSNVYWSVVSN